MGLRRAAEVSLDPMSGTSPENWPQSAKFTPSAAKFWKQIERKY
jgi:hypothetical protein